MLSKKRLFGLFLAVVMTFTTFTATAYAKDVTFKADGILYALETQPVLEQGEMLVPIKDIFKALDADMDWNFGTKTVTATKDDITLVLTAGKKEAFVNGERKYPPVPPKMSGNTLVVPLQFVCDTFEANLVWDEVTKVATITSKGKHLMVLDKDKYFGADAEVISYEDGLKKAISAQSSIKNLEESVEYWKEQIKTNRTNYQNSLIVGMEASAISIERASYALENQIINSYANEQIIKDGVELMYRSYLTQLGDFVLDLQTLEESVGLAQSNVKNIQLKNTLGMASDSELRKAKQELEQSKARMATLQISFKNVRMALNKLMELPAEKNVVVDFEPKIERFNVDIDGFVSAKIYEDPTIKMKKDAILQAEYVRDTSSEEILGESKLDKENAVNKAARDLYDTQNTMEKNMRSAYNTIKQMEANQKSLDLDLEKAKDTYKDIVASYEAGMITLYEVQQAKTGILAAEAAIDKSAYQYSNLIFQIERPYLLMDMSKAS